MDKMSKEEQTAYRGGFISCMLDIRHFSVNYVQNRAEKDIELSHTQFFVDGYRDGFHNWMGEVGEFSRDYAYLLRGEYEGYWGQTNFIHPSP